jgi:hypothetical protein
MRLDPQSKAKPGRRSSSRSVRVLVGALAGMLVLGASTLGLGLGAAGVNAAPLPAKSPKKILLQDPLSMPSSATPNLIFTFPNGSNGSFVNGKYVVQNTVPKVVVPFPSIVVDVTNAQLSATSATIDMSFATSAPQSPD